MEDPQGYYCSTSGTVFADKDALTDHYKSELHRYNLKRKVAGLPPVTAEWYDARKQQLASMVAPPEAQVLVCPLTKKKFQSEATYQAHTNTNKFRAALKKAGLEEAPAPQVVKKRDGPAGGPPPAPVAAGISILTARVGAMSVAPGAAAAGGDASDGDDSDWATDDEAVEDEVAGSSGLDSDASSAEAAAPSLRAAGNAVDSSQVASSSAEVAAPTVTGQAAAAAWEDWDVCKSFFDNHVSRSLQANLEYMYKHFGFYVPDMEYVVDIEGLLKYLGAKIQYGLVPLFSRGDDASAKHFRSLHAVQRHMVDANKCRMLFDDNEEEYLDFYEYPDVDENALTTEGYTVEASNEMALSTPGASQVKVLGSREYGYLYKQRHRQAEQRSSVLANQLALSYRNMGVTQVGKEEVFRRRQRLQYDKRQFNTSMRVQMWNDKIFNLKKNVPH